MNFVIIYDMNVLKLIINTILKNNNDFNIIKFNYNLLNPLFKCKVLLCYYNSDKQIVTVFEGLINTNN